MASETVEHDHLAGPVDRPRGSPSRARVTGPGASVPAPTDVADQKKRKATRRSPPWPAARGHQRRPGQGLRQPRDDQRGAPASRSSSSPSHRPRPGTGAGRHRRRPRPPRRAPSPPRRRPVPTTRQWPRSSPSHRPTSSAPPSSSRRAGPSSSSSQDALDPTPPRSSRAAASGVAARHGLRLDVSPGLRQPTRHGRHGQRRGERHHRQARGHDRRQHLDQAPT